MGLEDRVHVALGLYMGAPAWLRAAAGEAWRHVPRHLRYGRAYGEHLAGAALETAPWTDIESRLELTFRAAGQVPAYAAHRELLSDASLTPFERLRRLPLLSKTQIKQSLASYVRADAPIGERLKTFTGGSTAQPMQFYLQRHVSRPRESAYFERIESELLGARRDDWSLSLRGRTVASAARARGRLWSKEPIKRHVIFSSDHLDASRMPDYVDALRRLRPRLIHAFPSALYPLARWLVEHPEPSYTDGVEGVLLTSENVYGFQAEVFRAAFARARIVEHYGHSERVLMAVRRHAAAGLVFCPRYGLPELVDESGTCIDRPGVLGEIVGTSFDNATMPFLRYRTGDMGQWLEAPRYGCEPTARFVMQRIEGRLQEFVVCGDDRLVSITTLGAAHFHELAGVEAIQFEQQQPGWLILKVVSPRPLSAHERERIARAVEHKTQQGCRLSIDQVAQIERTALGKHRMLIQHLDLSRHWGAAVAPSAAPGRAFEAVE